MSRHSPRTLALAIVTSFTLVAAACGSDTTSPIPSAIPQNPAPASITPIPVASAPPEPTPPASPSQVTIGPGAWAMTGAMVHGRSYGPTATVMQDGRVLVTGGEADDGSSATAAAEVYDPATGAWSRTANMFAARRGHVATLLRDGRVLVTGGWTYTGFPPAFGELYEPATGTWTKTSPMTRSRYFPEAATLADGRVLVAGGWTDCGCSTRRAEIFDPSAGTWTATRNMPSPAGLATLLADGRVFVISDGQPAQTFDAASGRWHRIAGTPTGMTWSDAVRLKDGVVLLIGAEGKGELYDPAAGTWTAIDVPHTGRGPATLLEDGTVLVVGRVSSARFDPATGAWTAVPRAPFIRDYGLDSIDGVELNLMAALHDGRVLATSYASAAIYDPSGGG